MKVAILGRTEILYDSAILLRKHGHEVVCIVTGVDRPEYQRTAEDFAQLAKSWNIPFRKVIAISSARKLLRDSGADIGISVNYPTIIPGEIIDIFPHGILNAHGGDLPRYRGNACQAWAILNGEERIGLCIHKMIGGELDSGDIVVRDYFPVTRSTKITDVWNWMIQRTPKLFLDAALKLADNSRYFLEKQSTNAREALRCYPRHPEDGRIEWNLSALTILRLINASNKPYAGAFCTFENAKCIVWDAELVSEAENFCAVPGQVTKIGSDWIEVACGQGKLRILSVEYKGEISNPAAIVKSNRQRLS